MDGKATEIEFLFEKAEAYSRTTLALLKLNAIDKSAEIVSTIFSGLAVYVITILSVLILNIGLALWIGQILGNAYYGFFVTGGIYAMLALLLHVYRYVWIKNPLKSSIIKQMTNSGTIYK